MVIASRVALLEPHLLTFVNALLSVMFRQELGTSPFASSLSTIVDA